MEFQLILTFGVLLSFLFIFWTVEHEEFLKCFFSFLLFIEEFWSATQLRWLSSIVFSYNYYKYPHRATQEMLFKCMLQSNTYYKYIFYFSPKIDFNSHFVSLAHCGYVVEVSTCFFSCEKIPLLWIVLIELALVLQLNLLITSVLSYKKW